MSHQNAGAKAPIGDAIRIRIKPRVLIFLALNLSASLPIKGCAMVEVTYSEIMSMAPWPVVILKELQSVTSDVASIVELSGLSIVPNTSGSIKRMGILSLAAALVIQIISAQGDSCPNIKNKRPVVFDRAFKIFNC